MLFNYFYETQAEQFTFYEIPKNLFTHNKFQSLSSDAKILYGLMLNHMSLSIKNHWIDKEGRVYIINKFADENFKHRLYINLFELSGKQFMECYQKATIWQPGTAHSKHLLQEAFFLYQPDFVDNKETITIMDKIQESHEIYNGIREFTKLFECYFIITRSYLGRILKLESQYSSGDITKIRIYTLSYEEFLESINSELYQMYLTTEPLLIEKEDEPYYCLKNIYDVY